MLSLNCKITIKTAGNNGSPSQTWVFNRIAGCDIKQSAETLTDTCTITLPKKVKWSNAAETPIKRGDAITVQLGYGDDENLRTRFVGFIRSVGTKTPVEIKCEDNMWLLKQTPVEKKAYKNATLDQLLRDILPAGISFQVAGEQNIGQYRIKTDTVAAELDSLAKNGIRSYFKLRDGTPELHCGVLFPPSADKKAIFREGMNIIADETEQQQAEDIKIKIKAISIMPDNTKHEIELGDKDGETRTLQRYNIPEKELRSWAEQEMKKAKYSGVTGKITTFGIPEIDKEDCILLETKTIARSAYSVKSVDIAFNANGYRQTITLDHPL